MIARQIFLLISLRLFLVEYTNGEYPTKNNCTLSVIENRTIFNNLDEYFHKFSDILIVEYTLSFNDVSRKFNLEQQSSPNSFQPYKWYRTQGHHSSSLLRSYEKYFGMLRTILLKGVREVTIPLRVSPTDCLDQLRNEDLEDEIRSFLLTGMKNMSICIIKHII